MDLWSFCSILLSSERKSNTRQEWHRFISPTLKALNYIIVSMKVLNYFKKEVSSHGSYCVSLDGSSTDLRADQVTCRVRYQPYHHMGNKNSQFMFILYFIADNGENTTGVFLHFAGMLENNFSSLHSNTLQVRAALKRFRYILKSPL